MGGNVSTQSVSIMQTTVNETINKTLNEVNNSAQCKSDVRQTMIINLDDIVMDGKSKFTAGQTTEVNMECFVNNESLLASDVARDLENELGSESKLKTALENSGVNFGQVNAANTSQKVNQYIQNKLTNEVENVINNAVSLDQSASNTLVFNAGKITMTGEAEFVLSQSSVINVIGETISKNMVDAIINETGTNVTSADAEGESDLKNEGVDIGAIGMYILIVVVAFFVVVGIGWYIFADHGGIQAAQSLGSKVIEKYPGPPTRMPGGGLIKGIYKKYMKKNIVYIIVLLVLICIAIK